MIYDDWFLILISFLIFMYFTSMSIEYVIYLFKCGALMGIMAMPANPEWHRKYPEINDWVESDDWFI